MRTQLGERHHQVHNPKSKTNPSSINGEDSRSQRIMAKLKESIICEVGGPTVVDSSNLESRLQEVFPHGFNSPTHPPYSLMIRTAISELDEENGSTEEAISDFIKLKFHDLPFAHRTILRLQLDKLCQGHELALVHTGRYVLIDDTGFVARATTENKNQCNSVLCEMTRKEEALRKCIPVTGIVIELSSLSSQEEHHKDQVQQHGNVNRSKEKQLQVYQRRQGLPIRKT